MMRDEQYIKRCLDLAILGAGTVSPNPMVGAVIVCDENIIGEGYTSPYGGAHAEVNAVREVLTKYGEAEGVSLLQQSTVYVSLEPCAHHGKTPPCAEMLVQYAVKRVVIGCLDPFAQVNGRGVQILKEAGVEVMTGVLEQECKEMNRRFFTRVQQQRPYIILKWAETADGYFAPIDELQKWISNAASKQLVHKWRSEEDAILVGKNTALVDNSKLNNRLWEGKSPKRVLIDRRLDVSTNSDLYADDMTDLIVFNEVKTDWKKHIKLIALENFELYLPQNIAYQLYILDIQSLIVEGGAKTLQSFINANMWDEARVFVGAEQWGEGIPAPSLPQDLMKEKVAVGSDVLKIYRSS